jgi:ribosomal-protein-alanine N-acetyltransferase
MRSKGIGTMLIEHVVVFGRGKGAKMAVLEVRRSNEEALGLYKKFGFDVVGVRKNYYVEEREDAFVMLSVIEERGANEGLLPFGRRRRK